MSTVGAFTYPLTGGQIASRLSGQTVTTLTASTRLLSPELRATSSAGVTIANQSGQSCLIAGAGGGQGVSTVDGLTVGGALTATAGAVSLGATTVTSLNAGSGAITTTGALSAGAATVTSLTTTTGDIQAGGNLRSGDGTGAAMGGCILNRVSLPYFQFQQASVTLAFLAADTANQLKVLQSDASTPGILRCGYVAISDGVTAPGAGTGEARLYVDTADGDLKVVFADGTVKTIVTDT